METGFEDLTLAQQTFLDYFDMYDGDIEQVLKDSKIERQHLKMWLKDDNFYSWFCNQRTIISCELAGELKFEFVKIVNKMLHEGYVQEDTTSNTKVGKNGRVSIEFKTRRIKKPILPRDIKDLFTTDNFESNVNDFLQRGIIPRPIATQLLSTAHHYQERLKQCFDVEENENMSDEKTIGLIKGALLGSIENIE